MLQVYGVVCVCVLQVYITVLDSNDNPPVFSQSVYDVMVTEDTPPETELLRVTATDRDVTRHSLTFALQGSVDPASVRLFRVDPTTGAIHTAHTLDHESNTQHILTVMVIHTPTHKIKSDPLIPTK